MSEQSGIPARRGAGQPVGQPAAQRWVPSRMVVEALAGLDRLRAGRWPFGESPVEVSEDAVVVRLPGALRRVGQAWRTRAPRTDVLERDDELVVMAELPGVRKEDLDIAVEGGDLVIRGTRRIPGVKSGEALGGDRFYRRIALPEGIAPDKISAEYANGVLEVTIPRAAAKIPIS